MRDDLDLLAPGLEVGERDPRHPRHLHVVDDAHQLVEEPQRQVGVLQTVDSETSPGLTVAVLEVGDHRVVDIFLLLPEKVEGDSVESVGPQFVISNENQQQVESDATLYVDTLVLSLAHLL